MIPWGKKKKKRHCSLLGFSRMLKSFRSCRSSNSFSATFISSPSPLPINQYQYPKDFAGYSREKTTLARKYDDNVKPEYLWKKEDKWRVAMDDPNKTFDFFFSPQRSKIDSDDFFPPLSIPKPSYRKSKNVKNNRYYNNDNQKKKKKRKKKKRKTSSRDRASTSSANIRLFSSDEDDDHQYAEFKDNETQIYSSNSHSTLADCHYCHHRHNPTRCISSESKSTCQQRMKRISSSSSCTAGGGNFKIRDSFAVVKRSNDPYSDFRKSMLEMVIEKQIYNASDLKDLLRCFLSLNEDEHHKTILKAFSDVRRDLLVSSSSPSSSVSTYLIPLPPL